MDAPPAHGGTVTPEGGWPAQPDLTPREAFLKLLREDIGTLTEIAAALDDPKTLRPLKVRAATMRRVCGVIGNLESLRSALDRGRFK